MSYRKSMPLAAFLIVALVGFPLHALAAPVGPVVVARASGNGLLVWQATEFVDQLRAKHKADKDATADIETAALQIIVGRKAMLKNASSVSIKVLYEKVADTHNKEYAPTSFAGYQQVLILDVSKAALANSGSFPKELDPQHLPQGVSVGAVSLP